MGLLSQRHWPQPRPCVHGREGGDGLVTGDRCAHKSGGTDRRKQHADKRVSMRSRICHCCPLVDPRMYIDLEVHFITKSVARRQAEDATQGATRGATG